MTSHGTNDRLVSDLQSPNLLTNLHVQIYRIGLVIARKEDPSLVQSLQTLVSLLPNEYVEDIFVSLKEGLIEAVELNDGIEEGIKSLSTLYEASPTFVKASRWAVHEIDSVISARFSGDIIPFVSSVTFDASFSFDDFMNLHTILNDRRLWGDAVQYKSSRLPNWKDTFLRHFTDETERDYIQSVLETVTDDDSKPVPMLREDETVRESNDVPKVSAGDALQQRIDQVRQVLPDLGEGFVELALSYFKGDVEQTMSALFDEAQLPVQLQLLDRSLPRRHRAGARQKQEEEEAKKIAKKALREASRREEEKARLLDQFMTADEYDDDYDDQYDDMDGGTHMGDIGLYDNFEEVKVYNQTVRDMEKEDAFWEENRNTNRSGREGGQKKQFGPDKIRGGRIPKPVKEEETKEPTKNSRRKQRMMANRRAKQKDADLKRTGLK